MAQSGESLGWNHYHRMMIIKKNKKAISFIELMVVVIIIGIMAAFVLPNYEHMRSRAREKSDADNLDIIKQALKLYASRHSTGFPDLSDMGSINDAFEMGILNNQNTTYQCQNNTAPYGADTGYFCWVQDDNNADPWALYFKWSDTLTGTDMDIKCVDSTMYSSFIPCPSCDENGCSWNQ